MLNNVLSFCDFVQMVVTEGKKSLHIKPEEEREVFQAW
jgi:hypothetical protein